jgi:nucleotidyltransferase/DNA polymerase involved in DNA repair
MEQERYIVHVDMDAFYAAVEQRDHPEYRGKPVVVGADPKGGTGRGVVSACSYEARRFGIHSAMPISTAYRKCPHAVFLRGDMQKYVRISRQIFAILERFTPDIEPISIDEGFLDITGSYHLTGSPEETCRRIKAAIREETGLTASIGMAPNKMTAKIASDLEKPDGLVIVSRDGLLDFLSPLPVEKLWGVGKKTLEALGTIGIRTVGDLAARELKDVAGRLGKSGVHVWKLANGIDPRNVERGEPAKSIGHEHTFGEDEDDWLKIEDTLMWLSEKVSRRMRKHGYRGRTISVKIRLADFSTYTRAVTLDRPTNYVEDLYHHALAKVRGFSRGRQALRLLGIHVSKLEQEAGQLDLFQAEERGGKKREKLHEAVDTIKDRYGESAIKHRK